MAETELEYMYKNLMRFISKARKTLDSKGINKNNDFFKKIIEHMKRD